MKNINMKTLLFLSIFITTATIKTASKEEFFEGSDKAEIPLVATFYNTDFPNGHIRSIACGPNETIALADGEGIIKIYDINQNLITTFNTDQNLTNALTFSPDGTLLAAGTYKQTILVYDIETKECTNILGEPIPDGVFMRYAFSTTIIFSDDSHFLASGCLGYPIGNIKLWEKNADETYSPIDLQNKRFSTYWVSALALSPDGNTLSVSSTNQGNNDPFPTRDITMWNTSTGKTKTVINLSSLNESCPDSLIFNPDGSLMSAYANEIKIWKPSNKDNYTNPKNFKFNENRNVSRSTISPSGQLFTGYFCNALGNVFIELWDVNTQQQLASLELPDKQKQAANLMFSPDDNYILVRFRDTSVNVYDISGFNFDKKSLKE